MPNDFKAEVFQNEWISHVIAAADMDADGIGGANLLQALLVGGAGGLAETEFGENLVAMIAEI